MRSSRVLNNFTLSKGTATPKNENKTSVKTLRSGVAGFRLESGCKGWLDPPNRLCGVNWAEAAGLWELASCWIGFCGTAFDLSTFLGPVLRHSQCVVYKGQRLRRGCLTAAQVSITS
jgi:hypothetical protein